MIGTKAYIRKTLNSLLKRYDHVIVNERFNQVVDNNIVYEWQKVSYQAQPGYTVSKLPEGATDYLVTSNPRLKELQTRYANFNNDVTTPLVWTDDHVSSEDMQYFRGDNAYVWQVRERSMNIMAYALTLYYTQSIDSLGLLEKLKEDNYFGIYNFNINNKLVSRDLLDSISEIYFLEKHLNISSLKTFSVLDIGAGYGRLAHRMTSALPNIAEYLCTDAFAISTFISEYYLKYRNIEDKAKAIPLDKIDDELSSRSINIAVNIHSFSECKPEAIDWWLSLLAKHKVKYLMIVPNTGDTLQNSVDFDFTHIIEKNGYRLKAKEPKYREPVVQQYAINPTFYYLFELP